MKAAPGPTTGPATGPVPESGARVAAVVFAMMTVQAVATMGVLALAGIAPELGRSLGLDPVLIGYQIAVVYAGAMATSIHAGAMVRRFGAVRMSQAAMLATVLGAGLAATGGMAGLAVGSFGIGCAYGLTNPAASHLLFRLAPSGNRNLIFSLKQTGVPVGGVAVGLIGPPVTLAFGWQALPLVVCVVSLVVAAALIALAGLDGDRQPGLPIRQKGGSGGIGLAWRDPSLRYLSGTFFLLAAIQLCLVTYTVTLLVEGIGFDLVRAGILLAVVQVAGAAGRVLWGIAADRFGNGLLVMAVITALSGLASVGAGVMTAEWSFVAVAAVLALFGFTAVGWNGVAIAEVARSAPPGEVGTATGGVLFYTFAGVMAGPAAFAFLHGFTGSYSTNFLLLALVAGAGLAMLLALARRRAVAAEAIP